MIKQTLAEILVLFLLLLASSRFIFVRRIRNDSLAVLPLVALIISVTNLFVYNFMVLDIYVAIVAFFVFLWNGRSLLRTISDVIVDRYSVKLMVCGFISILLILFIGAGVIYLRPMKDFSDKLNVEKKVSYYTGKFEAGLKLSDRPVNLWTGRVTEYSSKVPTDLQNMGSETIILFVPPKDTDTAIYNHVFTKLAHDGYHVYAGEFWTNDMKWFRGAKNTRFLRKVCAQFQKRKNREEYGKMLHVNRYQLVDEYRNLLKLVPAEDGDRIFLLGEEDVSLCMKTYMQIEDRVTGCFDLYDIDNYSTKGYGPVENTEPAFAYIMGTEPDRTGYLSNHLALQIEDFISSVFLSDSL